MLTQPGFESEELEPWGEDGEIWRRPRAVFPARIASYSADQLFYFSPVGLLRRHDYRMEILGNTDAACTDDHHVFEGISFSHITAGRPTLTGCDTCGSLLC